MPCNVGYTTKMEYSAIAGARKMVTNDHFSKCRMILILGVPERTLAHLCNAETR